MARWNRVKKTMKSVKWCVTVTTVRVLAYNHITQSHNHVIRMWNCYDTTVTCRHHVITQQKAPAFHPSRVGKWVPALAGKAKSGMVHSVSGCTRGVQVKLWDPLRTRAIPEHLRGVFMTKRYTNPNLYLYLTQIPTWYVSLLQFQDFTFISWDLRLISDHFTFLEPSTQKLWHTSCLALRSWPWPSYLKTGCQLWATLRLIVGFLQPFILKQVWTGRQMGYKA